MIEIDVRHWPEVLDLGIAAAEPRGVWLSVGDLPDSVATGVVVDFDRRDLCCGLEIVDRALVASDTEYEAGDPPRIHSEQAEIPAPVEAWIATVRAVGGGGSDFSCHWGRRRAYDVSEELSELRAAEEGLEWLELAVRPTHEIVGIRFLDPRKHVHGLDAPPRPSLRRTLRLGRVGKGPCD